MIPITPLEEWIRGRIRQSGGGSRLTPSEISRFQLERINQTFSYAREKSPFYREHLRTLGDKPLRRLEDLSAFPFTTPADLASDPLRFLCVSQGEIEPSPVFPDGFSLPRRTWKVRWIFFITACPLL